MKLPLACIAAFSLAMASFSACKRTPAPAEPAPTPDASAPVSSVVPSASAAPSASQPAPLASVAIPAFCVQAGPWLSLPDRARRRLDSAARAVKSQGLKSLAGPALASAASKCAEAASQAVQELRSAKAAPEDAAARQALLVSLDAVMTLGRSLAKQPDEAALLKFDNDNQALEAVIRRQDKVILQRCPNLPTAVAAAPAAQVPIEPRTRNRASDGATLVFVPAGPYVRGADADDADVDEYPRKIESVAAFWIDRLEITVAQYQRCMDAKACSRPTGAASCNEGPAKGTHPINCVSWEQAQAYCKWAGARLATEAEWEKAARGVDGRTFPWGEELPSCDRVMFFDPKRGHGCGTHGTAAVGSKPLGASPYGAMDMAGNVWEWVEDTYRPRWDGGAAAGDVSPLRVLRGGGWGKDGWGSLRSTSRLRLARQIATPGTGIRCAMSGDLSNAADAP